MNPQLHARSSRDGSIVVVDRSVALLDSTGLSLLMHIQFGEFIPLEFHFASENKVLPAARR